MKTILRISILFLLINQLSSSILAQNAPPMIEEGPPIDIVINMLVEGESTKQWEVLKDIIHKDIEIYTLNGKLLSKGIVEAEAFYTSRFESAGHRGLELLNFLETKNSAGIKVRTMKDEGDSQLEYMMFIYTKNSKLYRLYL